MRKRTSKIIKKYVKLAKPTDDRNIKIVSGTVVRRNPYKYIKQLYKGYTKEEKRKFKLVVTDLMGV